MTAILSASPALLEAEILRPALNAAHDVWIHEASGYLLPVIAPEADFWERWTAARYLADQFLAQFERERALLDELRPFLPPEVVVRLDGLARRIAQRQEQLDRIGRRRGTAHTVAVAARALLQDLKTWCAELEATAGRLSRDVLPEQASRLLADLELYTHVHA
jgi:hypothetical protein